MNIPPPVDLVSTLIREGATLKNRINADRARLAEINLQLDGLAVFAPGKSTAHLAGAGFSVAVQRKLNVKWDQQRLENVRAGMGNEDFFKVFAWEFKPASAKVLNGFLDFGNSEHVQRIRAAMTVTQAAPYVTYTPLEDAPGVL